MPTKILLILFSASFAVFLSLNTPSPVRIQGDGVFYFSWAHSVIFDGDIDFTNELEYFSSYDFYSKKFITENIRTFTGLVPNPYAFGTALLWAPFILLAHVLSLLGELIAPELFRSDGHSFLYVFSVNFASWLFGTLAFLCNWRTLRQFFSEKLAFLSVTLFWLGTPWLYYQFFEPSMSHMASLLCVSMLVALGVAFWKGNTVPPLLLFGTVFLAVATRWQNAIFCVVTVLFFWQKERGFPMHRAFRLTLLALFAVGILQMFFWKILYDSFFLIPQGTQFVASGFHGFATLFSSDRGLFFWSPLFLLSFFGAFYWKRSERSIFWIVLLAFLGQWLINSLLSDPGGGQAFGARRYIETIPFLLIFFAGLLHSFSQKRTRIAFIALSLLCVGWNLGLLLGYHYDLVPRSGEFRAIDMLMKF